MHFKIISEKDKQLFKKLAKHKKKICLGFGILLLMLLLSVQTMFSCTPNGFSAEGDRT